MRDTHPRRGDGEEATISGIEDFLWVLKSGILSDVTFPPARRGAAEVKARGMGSGQREMD